MDRLEKNYQEINQFLLDQGIDDAEIRLELSDHIHEYLDERTELEGELIPSDFLTQVDAQQDQFDFRSTYKELIKIKLDNLNNRLARTFIQKYDIPLAFGVLLIHRLIFFIYLPQLSPEFCASIQPISMILTATIYFGAAGFFVWKAIQLFRAQRIAR